MSSWIAGRIIAAIALTFSVTAVAQPLPILRIGTSGDYAPFSGRDAEGKPTGFEITVAERLARDLGMQSSFVSFQWPRLVHDLQEGSFDIAMSGVTIRADRAVDLSFTRPYAVGGAVVVVRKGDARTFKTADAVNRAGVKIAVNAGGHLEQVARQRYPAATILPTTDNLRLPELLRDKSVDALVSDSFEVATWSAADFVVRGPFTRDRKAYAVRRGGLDLARRVNDWLVARESDGWLDQQRQHYFGKRAALDNKQASLEALVAAIQLRLEVMPYVAAIKRRDHLPITDAAQELRVLERAGAAAVSVGLKAEDMAKLFEALITAAKSVEHANANVTIAPMLKLADLRATIGSISDQIIAEMRRCAPLLGNKAFREQFRAALRSGLAVESLAPEVVNRIVESAERVRL